MKDLQRDHSPKKVNVFSIELKIVAIMAFLFCFAFQITSWYEGGNFIADFLSLICFISAIILAWQHREEERRKMELKLKEAKQGRIFNVNDIVKRDIKAEIERDMAIENARRGNNASLKKPVDRQSKVKMQS